MLKRYKINFIHFNSLLIFLLEIYFFGWIFLTASVLISLLVYHLGHSIYAHRHFAHNCYQFSNGIDYIMGFLFLSLNMGSPVEYASIHILHHSFSGSKKDPHDYRRLGFIRTFLGFWQESSFNIDKTTAKKFFKKKRARFFHNNYFKIVVPLSIVFAPITAMALVWRLFSVVVTHLEIGDTSKRVLETDSSNNCFWLKPILWGDEMHSNHHIKPNAESLNFSQSWKQIDLLFYISKYLEKF